MSICYHDPTQGYIEVHQVVQGSVNGGDLCLVEVWETPPPVWEDADGDGVPNGVEHFAGTDYTDAASFPAHASTWTNDPLTDQTVVYDLSSFDRYTDVDELEISIPAGTFDGT